MSCLFVLQLFLYILLAITTTTTNAKFMLSSSVVKGEKREFDYFKLALQWPPTACRQTQRCCSSNACCLNKSNQLTEFTIHGLWPDYNDGTWPSCCSGSEFDKKEISVLSDTLETYWPSLSCSSPSTCHGTKGSFWAHEWEKHGTCSYPVVQDEYDYFLTTLDVYLKYNVTRVLYEAGYVPSNTEKYPVGGIVSAIENAFHSTPSLQCFEGAIEELYLCFYKNFQPRDCAVGSIIQDGMYSENLCPNYVSLPAFVFSGSSRAGSSLLCIIAIIFSVFL